MIDKVQIDSTTYPIATEYFIDSADATDKKLAIFNEAYQCYLTHGRFPSMVIKSGVSPYYYYVLGVYEKNSTTFELGLINVNPAILTNDYGLPKVSFGKVTLTIANSVITDIAGPIYIKTGMPLFKYDGQSQTQYMYFEALGVNNSTEYTPTANYHPATKKYVDDKLSSLSGYDATKTQILKNINGTLTWVDE